MGVRTAAVVGLVVAAAVIGQLVTVVAVTSDSMSPAIEAGESVVVVPWTDPGPGDVVVFDAPTRPGHVAHRVVGTTPAGLVTRGDANPTTDQATGSPAIPRSAVVGTALPVGGQVHTLPVGADLLGALDHHRPLLLGAGALALLAGTVRASRRAARSITRIGDVVPPLLAATGVGAVGLLGAGVAVQETAFVASTGAATGRRVVPVGEAVRRSLTVAVAGPPFTTVLVESEGLRVASQSVTAGGVDLSVVVPARGTPGVVEGAVRVAPYPATLPRPVLAALHGVHPLVARVGSVLPVLGALYGLYALAVDGATPVRPPNSRLLSRWRGL
jgi:signal peptidase